MLHVHFGAGRLGLGLVVPFFQSPNSEVYILNRKISGTKPTGSTVVSSSRRNELLRDNPDKIYVIREPGNSDSGGTLVRYDGFFEYDDESVVTVIQSILNRSSRKQEGVIVTGAVLSIGSYGAILQALKHLADLSEQHSIGPLFLVACENTVSAHDVFEAPELCELICGSIRRGVTCVHALVDRVCVGLEEDRSGSHPTVLVRAETYGSLKLELSPETEPLVQLLEGTRVEFSRHVATEKQIKSWLLNGSHWLVALFAFQQSHGDQNLKLNEFLHARPEHQQYAARIMQEMRDGIAAILHRDPRYADFVRDVDADQYLDGAAKAILGRFLANEDPITRILARFRAPSAEAPTTIETFSKRLSDRVNEPITAYATNKGVAPPAATLGMQSLTRLIASRTFVGAA